MSRTWRERPTGLGGPGDGAGTGVGTIGGAGRADHPQHALAMRQMKAGGSVITVDVPGGRAAAFRLLDALRIIDISNNLGDAKSLMTHPSSTTHRSLAEEARLELGIGEGTLRLSVGLEDPLDLIDDLEQALARIPA